LKNVFSLFCSFFLVKNIIVRYRRLTHKHYTCIIDTYRLGLLYIYTHTRHRDWRTSFCARSHNVSLCFTGISNRPSCARSCPCCSLVLSSHLLWDSSWGRIPNLFVLASWEYRSRRKAIWIRDTNENIFYLRSIYEVFKI